MSFRCFFTRRQDSGKPSEERGKENSRIGRESGKANETELLRRLPLLYIPLYYHGSLGKGRLLWGRATKQSECTVHARICL